MSNGSTISNLYVRGWPSRYLICISTLVFGAPVTMSFLYMIGWYIQWNRKLIIKSNVIVEVLWYEIIAYAYRFDFWSELEIPYDCIVPPSIINSWDEPLPPLFSFSGLPTWVYVYVVNFIIQLLVNNIMHITDDLCIRVIGIPMHTVHKKSIQVTTSQTQPLNYFKSDKESTSKNLRKIIEYWQGAT